MLDASAVPRIIRAIEPCDPKTGIVFNDRLGPGAAHRGAEQQQVLNLVRFRALRDVCIGDDGIGQVPPLSQAEGLVEVPRGAGGLRVQPEPSVPANRWKPSLPLPRWLTRSIRGLNFELRRFELSLRARNKCR